MFENITKVFCNLGKKAVTQVQKAGDPPARMNPEDHTKADYNIYKKDVKNLLMVRPQIYITFI